MQRGGPPVMSHPDPSLTPAASAATRGVIRRDQVRLLAQPAMVECSAAPDGATMTVVPLMDGDRVAGLEVRCACGASTLIECVYDPQENSP